MNKDDQADTVAPKRDDSNYGSSFIPSKTGEPVVKPVRDDSNYGAAFRPAGAPQGIPCPDCGSRHYTKTIESRAKGNKIMRQKTCKNCQRVFTTYEALPGAEKPEKETASTK